MFFQSLLKNEQNVTDTTRGSNLFLFFHWFLQNFWRWHTLFFHVCNRVLKQKFCSKYQDAMLFSHPVMSNSVTPWTAARQASVPHHLLEFAQVHVHCIGDAIQSSHPLKPSSPSTLNLSHDWKIDFPMSQLFASDDQNTGVSASASVLPMMVAYY